MDKPNKNDSGKAMEGPNDSNDANNWFVPVAPQTELPDLLRPGAEGRPIQPPDVIHIGQLSLKRKRGYVKCGFCRYSDMSCAFHHCNDEWAPTVVEKLRKI